ncbi:hypothetical protein JH395_09595 [Lactiplantibacillus plantarum]|uniref:Uncharacterized protein n=1 Tax=Lactiplantibacillus plantarum TaxID=1590 RepID=A0AAX1KDR2_LACPN|nr:hypothetical protein [Lactiplantibacillus plantarum]MCG0738325.1 hypothetical protein [Lactiplantibacillus plantarum]QQM62462.1 hypothetical protein JH395_09595 [Lactiplantibacillus plantarum]WEZ95872.1 hypothetical protein P3T69_07930 [Lactiplantibacillus plantarum]WGI46744.1 hypothetical protein QC766_05420 [Lactiplantibacillus plantarum]WGI46801.1 hypothetical protein QC766_05725 [Lactiplantibacillus plantarum]
MKQNNYLTKKLVSVEAENKVTEKVIELLKKNDFTFCNFTEVVQKVKSFYENNGTI